MRSAPYNLKAIKQTVSLTINSDLYAQARSFGINASQVAEEALAYQVSQRRAEQLKAEIQQDLAALEDYEAKHGSFVRMAREHYQGSDEP